MVVIMLQILHYLPQLRSNSRRTIKYICRNLCVSRVDTLCCRLHFGCCWFSRRWMRLLAVLSLRYVFKSIQNFKSNVYFYHNCQSHLIVCALYTCGEWDTYRFQSVGRAYRWFTGDWLALIIFISRRHWKGGL